MVVVEKDARDMMIFLKCVYSTSWEFRECLETLLVLSVVFIHIVFGLRFTSKSIAYRTYT